MRKRVILIVGTPCVGKTTIAKNITAILNAHYINLTELAQQEKLILGIDKERETDIIDETKIRIRLRQIIKQHENVDIVIDGHYAAAVTPKAMVTHIFVLRRNPAELRLLMQKRGFSKAKQMENLSAEILDVCLIETLQKQPKEKVCELNITGKSLQEVIPEVMTVLECKKKYPIGNVNWLSILEKEGTLEQYLNT
jgi:adenylate kinase